MCLFNFSLWLLGNSELCLVTISYQLPELPEGGPSSALQVCGDPRAQLGAGVHALKEGEGSRAYLNEEGQREHSGGER